MTTDVAVEHPALAEASRLTEEMRAHKRAIGACSERRHALVRVMVDDGVSYASIARALHVSEPAVYKMARTPEEQAQIRQDEKARRGRAA